MGRRNDPAAGGVVSQQGSASEGTSKVHALSLAQPPPVDLAFASDSHSPTVRMGHTSGHGQIVFSGS
jgi:hypothetical protein